jgi:hypothetical protein
MKPHKRLRCNSRNTCHPISSVTLLLLDFKRNQPASVRAMNMRCI